MRDIPLTMSRPDLGNLPVYGCPLGFAVRSYAPGDAATWAAIEAKAGPFATEADALAHFETEFAPHAGQLPGRMLFLVGAAGPIGTTTAWFGEFKGRRCGRIHWVAILPAFQGRGLAKPLLSAAMARIAAKHACVYLTTETTSWRGINLYLGFGFEPVVETPLDREGWAIVEEVLGKPIASPRRQTRPH